MSQFFILSKFNKYDRGNRWEYVSDYMPCRCIQNIHAKQNNQSTALHYINRSNRDSDIFFSLSSRTVGGKIDAIKLKHETGIGSRRRGNMYLK